MRLLFRITLALILLFPALISASDFGKIIVSPDPNTVSDPAGYRIDLEIRPFDLVKLYKGSIKVDFPPGFGLSEIDSVKIRGKHSNYESGLLEYQIDGQSLLVYLNNNDDFSASLVAPDTFYFSLIMDIQKVLNVSTAGNFQVSLTGYNQNGQVQVTETTSEPFEIITIANSGLTLLPDTSLTIQAGRTVTFHAFAFDPMGNQISPDQLSWSLLSGSDPIGYLEDSVFNATTVGMGRVVVSSPYDSDTSETITVTPGSLSRITLEVEKTQVVDNDFRPVSQITLYDSYNNIKYDYDIVNNPLFLETDQGELSQTEINDPNLLYDGSIDLTLLPVQYYGASVLTNLTVNNGQTFSNIASAFMNGYDIVDILGYSGTEINSVFVGHQTFVKIPVVNNGNLTGADSINVSASFSSSDVFALARIAPPAPGVVDTILMSIPSVEGTQLVDTLEVSMSSSFILDSETYFVNRSFSKVLNVIQTNTFSYVDNSFNPDTILTDKYFDFNFQVDLGNLNLPIDSSKLILSLLDPLTDSLITVFNGNLVNYELNSNIITYYGSGGYIDSSLIVDNSQSYQLVFDYMLFSGGSLFKLEEEYNDSVFVIKDFGLEYQVGSFYPTQIYSGTDVRFHFKIDCEYTKSITFLPELSSFTVYDTGFSTTTRLTSLEDTLVTSGTKFSTNVLSFQSHLIGSELSAMAEIKYLADGIADTLTFVTNFPDPNFPIKVLTPPSVQVLDLEVLSPNPPRINTNQEFQIRGTIANTGTTPIDSLTVELVTVSGSSIVSEPVQELEPIAMGDTAQVIFNITASSNVSPLPESFRLDILSYFVVEDNPVNNSAIIFIENPANIELIFAFDGVAYQNPIVVGYNEVVNLAIALNNQGDAKASAGTYELILSGLNFEKTDTIISTIQVDSLYTFSYRVPQYDTTIQIDFRLSELPIDINSGNPAIISDSVVNAEIIVASTESELLVETTPLGSNLLLPGRIKQVASLKFTNTSNSEFNTLELEEINVQVENSGNPVGDLLTLFVQENTGFFENNNKQTDMSTDEGKLIFLFDNFTLAPGESRTIIFQAELRENSLNQLSLNIDVDNIKASFVDGPNAGLPAVISSTNSGGEVLDVEMVVKSQDLENSFLIANNPVNPLLEQVEFSYELVSNSDVEFRIFTLTGELVFEKIYKSGSVGGLSGENIVYWDGRNGDYDMVVDGIYIAHITIVDNDETATIKVAIVK